MGFFFNIQHTSTQIYYPSYLSRAFLLSVKTGFCGGSEGHFPRWQVDYYLRHSSVQYRTVLACLMAITIKCSTSTRSCYNGIVSMAVVACGAVRHSCLSGGVRW